jgi:hypothetical protein
MTNISFSKNRIVGPRILENYDFLKNIAKTNSDKKRLKFLRDANSDELLALVEVCSNILSSNFWLTKRQKEKILPYANYIRKLSRVRSESTARRVSQKGGAFIFSSLLIPVLAEAARLLISSARD